MTNTSPRRRGRSPFHAGLSTGVALVLVLVGWVFFAPVQIGGPFSYFQIVGDSMEPNLTRGDLVLLRTSDRYEPGEVIAYRDPDLGTVLHRIRDLDGDQFILRGDNRDSDDPYRPNEDEIVGQLWKVVPRGGEAMLRLQSPQMSALLGTGALAFGAISLRGKSRPQGGRRRPTSKTPASGGWGGLLTDRAQVGATLLSAAGLAFAAAALLAGIVLVNPAVATITRDVAVEHAGTFDYSGAAGTGIYDDNTVRTGDPVFIALSPNMPVTYTYDVSTLTNGRTMENVQGSVRLTAEISQENGWRRSLPVTDWTPFEGKSATVSGTVDLVGLLAHADRMEEATALVYPQYALDIVAEVQLQGDLVQEPFVDLFEARLPFTLSDLVLTPVPGFRPDAMGAVSFPRTGTGPWTLTVPVVGVEVEWGLLRMGAIGLGVAAVVLLGIVGVATKVAASRGEAALIASRFGALIVNASSTEVMFAGRSVRVRAIDDLVKMARQDGLFIVHDEVDGDHRYHLVLPDVTYTYQTGDADERRRAA